MTNDPQKDQTEAAGGASDVERVVRHDLAEIAVLRRIRETITPLLKDGVRIRDLVYRPADFGIFGNKGYSLVLCKAPDKVIGIRFEKEPSTEEIISGVEKVQNIIAPNAK